MEFTKQTVDKKLQSQYEALRNRYFLLISVRSKVQINIEVDLSFIWESGVECRPYYLDAIDYLTDTNAEKQIEDKIEEISKSINKDIAKFCKDLEKFSEKTDFSAESLMESFEGD